MYTVKRMLSCHFSLSLSYSHSFSIHLSLPSRLLHHLCSCNKRDSSCALFRSLACSALLIPARPPLRASLLDRLVGVTRWSYRAVRIAVYKNGFRNSLQHTNTEPCQVTQHFHLSVKACRKRKCENLTCASSVACTRRVITLNYSGKTKPSPSHSKECTNPTSNNSRPHHRHTIDLSQSSYWHPTQLDNGKISVTYCV